jgi:hypothetical protein
MVQDRSSGQSTTGPMTRQLRDGFAPGASGQLEGFFLPVFLN